MNDRDLDAEFQRIVAGWDDEAPARVERGAADLPPVPPADPGADTAAGTPSGQDPGLIADEAVTDAMTDAMTDAVTEGRGAGDVADDGSQRTGGGQEDPSTPAEPSGTSPTEVSVSGAGLGLPIASTTSHVWRASTPSDAVEDVDDLLDEGAARRGEPGDHFVPPSDIDLPSAEADPMFWAIVGGLVGGPLLLLYLLFFDRDGSGWWVVMALTMVVVGFVLLVLRGGTERDPFDDGTRV